MATVFGPVLDARPPIRSGDMTTVLHQWINSLVRVTLGSEAPTVVEGTLFQIDAVGIMLEKSTGKVFIPFSAISHIKRCDESEL
jgi:hypothetical protein